MSRSTWYSTVLTASALAAGLTMTGSVASASPEACAQFGSAIAGATADAESVNTVSVLAKGQQLITDVDGLTARFTGAAAAGETCAYGDGNTEVNIRYLQLRKAVLDKKEVLNLFFYWEPVTKSMKRADAAYPDAVEDAPDLSPAWG